VFWIISVYFNIFSPGTPVSKNAKLKLCLSVIRPVVTYACETWTLKETITNRLMVVERKILRKIFGPTYENL